MRRPAHFYHVWAGDDQHVSRWEPAAEEHFEVLRKACFGGDVYVGLVGELPYRERAARMLAEWWPAHSTIMVQADEGYEQVTINEMHKWCKWAAPDVPVFYAHTKGALHWGAMNTNWRNAMDEKLAGGWLECVKSLHTYDSVGLHWLTSEQYPEYIDPEAPMWGGNFWWANAGYLAQLDHVRGTPEFPPVNRWGAEGWMGRGMPKVLDLKPGWPVYG